MKASDIAKLLEGVDPDATFVIRTSDHGYRAGRITPTTALQEGPGQWCEDHGESVTPEADYGKRVPVLVAE